MELERKHVIVCEVKSSELCIKKHFSLYDDIIFKDLSYVNYDLLPGRNLI